MPSGSVDLRGKVVNQAGSPKAGLTVSLYEAATWEADGAATATDTTDSDGIWNFDAQDITKTWIVVVVDGTKKFLIDARNKLQLTNIDLIDDLSVDTISEHTPGSGVTIDGVLLKDSASASGASLTREGGNTTEATTTSTSDVDLLSVASLTIAAATPILANCVHRRTTGANARLSLGLKLNSTDVVTTTVVQSAGDNVVKGWLWLWMGARISLYERCVWIRAQGGSASVDAIGGTDAPTAQITDFIITAKVESASITGAVDELHVYSTATS